MAAGDPEHSEGTHAKIKNSRGEAVPKDDKIGKRWVIFNPSGSRLSGCKSPTMARGLPLLTQADVKYTHTHTAGKHKQEGSCTVIHFAITHNCVQAVTEGGRFGSKDSDNKSF